MMQKIISSKLFRQFIKFSVVGAIGTAIDFGVLNLGVIVLEWNIYLAATLAFVLAASNNFALNKYWTFLDKRKGNKLFGQYFQYLLISIGGLLLNLGIMYALIEGTGLWYNWAKIFATALVIMWNFSLNKYWTFKTVDVKVDSNKVMSNE